MPYFDRFDICAAHLAVETHYHVSGWLQERPGNRRRMEATHVQRIAWATARPLRASIASKR